MAEKEKKSSIWSTIGSIVFAITVMSWIPGCGGGDEDGGSQDASTQYKKGDKVKTKYFNVTVQKVGRASALGSEYARQKAGPGNVFIWVDASYENISDESRMLTGGELEITLGERKLRFDETETIFEDGYCTWGDTINPLVTKRCITVWTVPYKIGMIINFIPPRSKARILIGVIRE